MDVVITVLFTKLGDPARPGSKLAPSITEIQELLNSIHGCEVVVLHDELNEENRPHLTFERVHTYLNPYFQRWVSIQKWLLEHEEVDRIWCVDGTDVTMLRYPFDEQEDGVLYLGSETRTLYFPCQPWPDGWLPTLHPSVRAFVGENPDLTLLNAGICGGDRETVLTFLTDLVALFPAAISGGDLTDMGVFNHLAWTKYASSIVTGDKVHTVFCAMDYDNKVAWWRHK